MNNKISFGKFDKLEMKYLLLMAESDPKLTGYVYPDDESRARLPIYDKGILWGFANPRQDTDGVWRMGAIFVSPEVRGRGLARNAITEFMRDKRGRAFIEDDNFRSQKAYAASGFWLKRDDRKNKGSWWENF